MGYRLRPRLSACVIGDQAIFLDIEHDRYFALAGEAAAAVKALLAGEAPPTDGVGKLVSAGLVREVAEPTTSVVAIAKPTRSLVEEANTGRPPHLSTMVEVAQGLRRANRALRDRALGVILDELAARRPPLDGVGGDRDGQCLDAALSFLAARGLAPVSPRCLPDSLALLDWLGRRGLGAELVFGVKLNPFSAHCWVQVGGVVLNDALDRVTVHTPILIV